MIKKFAENKIWKKIEKKKKKNYKKKLQNGWLKKNEILNFGNSQCFSWKLIDARGNDVPQPIGPWAYVGQPHFFLLHSYEN